MSKQGLLLPVLVLGGIGAAVYLASKNSEEVGAYGDEYDGYGGLIGAGPATVLDTVYVNSQYRYVKIIYHVSPAGDVPGGGAGTWIELKRSTRGASQYISAGYCPHGQTGSKYDLQIAAGRYEPSGVTLVSGVRYYLRVVVPGYTWSSQKSFVMP